MHTKPWTLSVISLSGLVLGDWTNAMADTVENWSPWGMHMMGAIGESG